MIRVKEMDKMTLLGEEVKLGGKWIKIETEYGALILTEGQARELCIGLERTLYCEPTYDDLADEVIALVQKVEDLESELEGYREEPIRYVTVRI
ncbi:hypothetical protein EUAN_12590 [Andreesenia angusta]|uniref:Uncharacterized protein n=1 Tax=Andreesenia angusta TaxID=39480 RepID=A0A1S1V6Z3_9FIRM|nr:hypothetical protein [Andreesenia angusta]OHW62190.1 hypothetical protein EUAN_12590 [Andreesenia angusta]